MKNPFKVKGSYIGLLVTILILALAFAKVPLFADAVQGISRAIMDILCPSGGLECLGLAIPLLLGYLLFGFFAGYAVSMIKNRNKK